MEIRYRLEGEMCIPEEKRKEFNQYVFQILDKCGIRKKTTVYLNGKEHVVIDMPKPDENGIVYFDYSIFDKEDEEVSCYDMNTCNLHLKASGNTRFESAMSLIMMLQEAYSGGKCYLTFNNQLSEVCGKVIAINEILGIQLSLPERDNLLDVMLFCKKSNREASLDFSTLRDRCIYPYGCLNIEQLMTIFLVQNPEILSRDCAQEERERDITNLTTIQIRQIMEEVITEYGEHLTYVFLKDLLCKNFQERHKLAEQSHPCAILAEMSLYELPSMLVAVYAHVVQKDFYDIWFELDVDAYTDYIDVSKNDNEKKNDSEKDAQSQKESQPKRLLYHFLGCEYEDQFIEFWNDQNLLLSDEMQEEIDSWKGKYEKIKTIDFSKLSIESELSGILEDMYDIWGCRYVDKVFVDEFLAHREDEEYKRAIYMLRQMLDTDKYYFPELTITQVREWVTKCGAKKMQRDYLSGYQSLLRNHLHRRDVLGF